MGLHTDSRGVVAVRGQLRWAGRHWTEPGDWARQVADGLRWPYDHPLEGVVGDGCVVAVDHAGRGVAVADQVGLATLFRGTVGAVEVVGTRPTVVARAMATVGPSPRPDPLIGAWFVTTGAAFGASSSIAGVERLLPGTCVVVRDGRLDVRWAPPWHDPHGLDGLHPDELVDVAEEVVLDHLRAAVALADGPPVLDLTGGKDSRVVLAVAHARLGLDRFRVSTVGEASAPDVLAAAGIAAHLGVPHESGIVLRPPAETYAERVDRFVDRTDGMHSAWMFLLPHADPPEVRVSGTTGEILRTGPLEDAWRRDLVGAPSRAGALEFVLSSHRRGSGALLLDDVVAEVERRVAEHLDDLSAAGVPAGELLDELYIRHHGAKFAGLRVDLEPDHRVRPLADPTLLRITHLLGTDRRVAEDLHFALVERASPLLAALPLLSEQWGGDRRLVPVPPTPAPVTSGADRPGGAPPPPPPADAARYSALGVAQAKPNEQRLEFVRQAFADDSNPIWEVADRARVKAAVEGFDDLRMKPRQQLYGLATAARWARSA
jgi:hypothetical protein